MIITKHLVKCLTHNRHPIMLVILTPHYLLPSCPMFSFQLFVFLYSVFPECPLLLHYDRVVESVCFGMRLNSVWISGHFHALTVWHREELSAALEKILSCLSFHI